MPVVTPDRLLVEDEMADALDGEVTVIEGDAETLLHPGDAVTFRAGEPVGHDLHDRSLPEDIWTDGGGNPAPNIYRT